MYNWRNDPLPKHNRWATPRGRWVKFVAFLDRPTAQGSFTGIFIALPLGLLVRYITENQWAGMTTAVVVWAIIKYTIHRLARHYGLIANYTRQERIKTIAATVVIYAVVVVAVLL
jgi:hypothetical protein